MACCGSAKRVKLSDQIEHDLDCAVGNKSNGVAYKDPYGLPNGHTTNLAVITPKSERTIVCLDMCYFCFDVLYAHLHRHGAPETPNTFPNDP